VTHHFTEDDLTLYYYGEGRGRHEIERHLESCAGCAATYREIAGTLAMVATPGVPERGDQYGLEVWQRIRHKLPERPEPWWAAVFRRDGLVYAAAAAMLVLVAFVAGRVWPRQQPAGAPATGAVEIASGAPGGDSVSR
jgi:anti-sigma factor RsiW